MTRGLGDSVELALTRLGITSERVQRLLGTDCGCEERKQQLNMLSNWTWRILHGKTENAEKYLNEILEME